MAEKKKTGPARRTDWQEPFLEAFALLGIQTEAAKRASVSTEAVRAERARDPEFAERFVEAQKSADGVIERYIQERGTIGQPVRKTVTREIPTRVKDPVTGKVETVIVTETTVTDTRYISTAALLALARARMPERYGNQVRLTGPDDGPIQVEIERRPSRQRILELVQLTQELGLPVIEHGAVPRELEPGDDVAA